MVINDVVRLAVQNDGHKFWEKDPFFRFRFPYNRYGVGGIPIEFAQVHWLRLFPMWVRITLHSPFFEVFRRTPTMGLGLRARVWTSLRYLAPEISAGFLDYISEEEEEHQDVDAGFALRYPGHEVDCSLRKPQEKMKAQ